MVTGYFTKELYGDNATLRRKAERLLVPWLAYSVLMYVLFRPEPLLKNIARTLYAGSFNVTFYSYPWWFVNAMMVALILFSLLNRVKIGGGITALACYILIHISFLWEALPIPLPWSIDNALGAMVYIYVGWRMKEYVFRWTHLWVLIIPVLFIWINWHFRWHYHLNMKDMHFENALLDVVVPQSFTFLFYVVSLGLSRIPYVSRALAYVGMSSLTIFFVHAAVLHLVKPDMGALISVVTSVIVGVAMNMLWSTNAYTRYLFLGHRKRAAREVEGTKVHKETEENRIEVR